ncbi:hypothetical protein DOTSEDRAFT_34491 [Dothistroma septosporum NZE10]|uniref:SnoaL-like domain-containing protein n=1 Tax=Dothistroma septosporum (strain NZE10 / CBS 128990) TaxID=675120 RepID=N1PKA2_DOTSN|nr:hypothetical protein DOTSEDRAFT_34491 [Dothistroma septosporum NZE10]
MTLERGDHVQDTVQLYNAFSRTVYITPRTGSIADRKIELNLEQWTRDILEALNACDYTNEALQHLVPDFKSDRETVEGQHVQPVTKDEFLAKHQHWSTLVPQRTLKALDVVCNFDSRKGKADVWAWVKVSGWGAGHMDSESVSCFKWQRSQDIWWCHQHTGMRGFTPMQCSY